MNYLTNIKIGFNRCVKDGVIYYTVPAFEPYVNYAFCGDISNNMSFKAVRSTDTATMQSSYSKLCCILDMSYKNCVMTNIVHGDTIIAVEDIHKGCGVSSATKLPPCDGLIISQAGIPVATTHADCMPIAYYDKRNNVGCVIHAGWRGILAGIQKRAVETLIKNYDSSPADLLVAVGPTIQQCCFEVDKDVTESFKKAYMRDDFIENCGVKDRLDLFKLAILSILNFGIPQQNITVDDRCTACKNSGLESYRRDKDKAGTMVQIMCLK